MKNNSCTINPVGNTNNKGINTLNSFMNRAFGYDSELLSIMKAISVDSKFKAWYKEKYGEVWKDEANGVLADDVNQQNYKSRLIEYYNRNRLDLTVLMADKSILMKEKGYFSSPSDRIIGVNVALSLFSEIYFKSLLLTDKKGNILGKNFTLNDYINNVIYEVEKISKQYYDIISKKKDENPTIQAIVDSNMSEREKIINLLGISDNVTLKFWSEFLKEVTYNTDDFFKKVLNDKRLQYLNKELANDPDWVFVEKDNVETEEDKKENTTEDEEQTLDDEVDSMSVTWEKGVGNLPNAMQHVDHFVRAYINSLHNLKSTIKENGKYKLKTIDKSKHDNNMNAEEVINIIYSSANINGSLDDFINSIKQIAEQQENMAGLIQLYDLMKADKNIAFYFSTNFRKNKITKNLVNNIDGEFNIRDNSKRINKTKVLSDKLIADAKYSIIYNDNNYINKELSRC